nr:phage major capsid protein [Rhodovulum sp. PH10]
MVTTTNKRFDEIEAKLEAEHKRGDEIETAMNRTGTGGGAEVKKGPTLEEKAFSNFIRRGVESLPEVERKSLTVGSNQDGGYLVTSQFQREIIKNLVQFSPVRQAARVGRMSSSQIILPKRTAAPTAHWVGEEQARSATQAAYGQLTISAHEAACYVDASIKLVEDSEFPIEQEIAADLAEEFGRIEGAAFVSGDGVNKPFGILSSAAVPQVASGHASTITADALIDALYALPAFYRSRSAWMLNSTTLAAIRKLKDGQGQYLWAPGLQPDQPSTLLGRPVIDAPDMPDIAGGAFPIVLGDFASGYRIFDRVDMTILRDPYTQATNGLVRFHCRRRVGGDVVKAEALRKIKVAASV